MSRLKEIKPCPYCGNPDPQIMHPAYSGGYMIYCGVWACNMPFTIIGDTLEEAINDWNNFEVKND